MDTMVSVLAPQKCGISAATQRNVAKNQVIAMFSERPAMRMHTHSVTAGGTATISQTLGNLDLLIKHHHGTQW